MFSLFRSENDSPTRPGILNMLTETTVVAEYAAMLVSAPWLTTAPSGDGHPVLVLPGFLASDLSTAPMRNFLNSRGYNTHTWELGRNLGPQPGILKDLEARFHQLFLSTNKKISIIGWSLGGLYARHLAHVFPDEVRQVITLGTPIKHPESTAPAQLFRLINREVDDTLIDELGSPLPVPATAVYSSHDGVVPWQCSIQDETPLTENIRVWGSHVGMGIRPTTLWLVAERLSQPEGKWQKFERNEENKYAVAPECDWLIPSFAMS